MSRRQRLRIYPQRQPPAINYPIASNLSLGCQKKKLNNFIINDKKINHTQLAKNDKTNKFQQVSHNSTNLSSIINKGSKQLKHNKNDKVINNGINNNNINSNIKMHKYQVITQSHEKIKRIHQRSYSSPQRPRQKLNKQYGGANIINMTSNLNQIKSSQSLPLKSKSSYCKRITLSNLQKYYRYCVDRIKDKNNIEENNYNFEGKDVVINNCQNQKQKYKQSKQSKQGKDKEKSVKTDEKQSTFNIKKKKKCSQKNYNMGDLKYFKRNYLINKQDITALANFQISASFSEQLLSRNRSHLQSRRRQVLTPKIGKIRNIIIPKKQSYFTPWQLPENNFDQFGVPQINQILQGDK